MIEEIIFDVIVVAAVTFLAYKIIDTFVKDQIICSGGGIGRHAGLKILFHLNGVRVQFPPRVLKNHRPVL